MIPVSLYISLPYYLFALLWSGIYSVYLNIKQGIKMLGDSYINYHIIHNEKFDSCNKNLTEVNF